MKRALVVAALSLLAVVSLSACGTTNQSAPPAGTTISTVGAAPSTTSAELPGGASAVTDAQVAQLEADVNSVQGTVDQLDQLSSEQ